MNNGPEIHDEKGIECMRASGKLAAQVLKFAGTLVKVMPCCYKSLILSISKLLSPLDKPHSFYSF
jgi:methionyl aminopeptidase